MNKKILNILLLLIFLFITGCTTTPSNKKTYEVDLSQLNEDIYVGEFDVSKIRIKETTSDGTITYINCDETMFTIEDYGKFNQVGEHKVTVIYKLYKEEITIIIKDKKQEGGEDKDNNVFTSTNSYYAEANGKTGTELKLSLRNIISKVKKTETYGDLRYDIPKTDTDPTNPQNIILLYTGKSVSSTWDGGATWNREHVWAQSLGWFKTEGAGADLHHIRPTDPSENSRRGNKLFGTASGYYEPRDEVKGDVARIIFYLMVRYQEADNYTFKSIAQSKELLIEWHNQDPVDSFELNRNEQTYKIQGNRNPFIDHPECVELIYGQTLLLNNFNQNFRPTIVMYIYKKKENNFLFSFSFFY